MRTISEAAVDNLAALHRIDIEATGLISMGKPEGYIGRQVDGWARRYYKAETDTVQSMDEAYPVATPPPTLNPYPGGFAVILLAAGAQCEEVAVPNLSAAIGMLEEAGIVVLAAEEIAMNVCQACGCPTSVHYRAQIHPEDLETAYELGWYRG